MLDDQGGEIAQKRGQKTRLTKTLLLCVLGGLVQAAIIGFAIQSKAQDPSANLAINLQVPNTVLVEQSFTITMTIQNTGSLPTTYYAGASTQEVTLVEHDGTPSTGCVANVNANFLGYDCPPSNNPTTIDANGQTTVILPWRALQPGTIDWSAFVVNVQNTSNIDTVQQTTLITVTSSQPITATIEVGENQPEDTTLREGDSVPVLQVLLNALNSPIRIQSFTLDFSGTFQANRVGIDFYQDNDNDGQIGDNDTFLGGDTAVNGSGVYTLTNTADLPQGTSRNILILATLLSSGSTRTAAAGAAPLWPLLLGLPVVAGALCVKRHRKFFLFVCLVGSLLWLTTGCPSDDEDGGTFTVTLVNVGAINPNNGNPVAINGLPIAGAAINVQP